MCVEERESQYEGESKTENKRERGRDMRELQRDAESKHEKDRVGRSCE